MTVADTSVWIAHLKGQQSPATTFLRGQLATEVVPIGDLVLMEVLKGLPELTARRLERELRRQPVLSMASQPVVLRSARNYRRLRDLGFTIRSSIDCIIATFCIAGGHELLHQDRDFEPFETHLGLKVIHPEPR